MKYEVLYNLMVVSTWSSLTLPLRFPDTAQDLKSKDLDLNSAFSISGGQVQDLCSLFLRHLSDVDLSGNYFEGIMKLLRGTV